MSRGTIYRLVASTLMVGALLAVPARSGSPTDPAATREIPAFTIPPAKPGVAYEHFMAIGDIGSGRPDQYQVAAAMAKRAEKDGLGFILLVGDNILPEGVQSADDPKWKTGFEDVYAHPALRVPVYAVLGNHDHRGNIHAQVEYSARNKYWRMPAIYYTFVRTLADGTRVQFFALDTTPMDKKKPGVDAQLAWLDHELSISRAHWKIVFGHHPLYSHNPRRGPNPRMIPRLEPLFTKHDVDLYLAGHHHALDMLKPIKGVHYVVTGAAGGADMARPIEWTDESYYAATLGGFVLCRVSRDELVIEFVRPDGHTQYAHTLTK